MRTRLRNPLLPVVVVTAFAGCEALEITTIPVEDRELPAAVAAAYREDAARMALRHLGKGIELASAPAEVPDELATSLYYALARVYHAAAADYDLVAGIHTFPEPEMRSLLVHFRGDASFASAWRRSETLTGERALDELLARYDLVVSRYYNWSIGEYVTLTAVDRPLNLARVARELRGVSGILLVESNGSIGGGNDITVTSVPNGWQLTYHLRWGDCPAGCIEGHWWRFTVLSDGTVRFDGEGGSPLGGTGLRAPPAPGA